MCQEMPESETKCTTTQPGRTLVRRKLDETSPAGSKSERPVRAYLGQIYRWLDRRTQVAKFTKSRSMEVLISNVYEDKIYTTRCPRKNTFLNFRFRAILSILFHCFRKVLFLGRPIQMGYIIDSTHRNVRLSLNSRSSSGTSSR